VSPDNQSFVMIRSSETELPAPPLHFVLNWSEELKRRFPARKD
jgi:hypothetical protein